MNHDEPDNNETLDEILEMLSFFESIPCPDSLPACALKINTKSLVRALARHIENQATVLESGAIGLAALAREMEGKPRAVSLDDLILRFGRAAILRMATSGEPNKAFGYLHESPGNKPDPFFVRAEALNFGAYIELARRDGCGFTVAIDRAAGHFNVSVGTVRNRLKLLAEKKGHADLKKGLQAAFQDYTSDDLRAWLDDITIDPD